MRRKQDYRPYARTAEPGDDDEPQPDLTDRRFAWWYSKRIWLGSPRGQVAKLFWLLSRRPRPWMPLHEVQKVIDGMVTDEHLGASADDLRKAGQRVRKVVAKLRRAMRECLLDDHVWLVAHKSDRGPGYRMILPGETEARRAG